MESAIEMEDAAARELKENDGAQGRQSRSAARLRSICDEFGFGSAASGWPIVRMILALLPPGAFARLRTQILRAWGMRLGRGVLIAGTPVLSGDGDPRRRLHIGDRCFINWPVHFDTNGSVRIGDRVTIGHHVVIVTTDHKIGDGYFRAGSQVRLPVVIGDGVWIGACATILPGAIIGEGAVVAAGAVVRGEVPAHTLVGGVPAKPIRELDGHA